MEWERRNLRGQWHFLWGIWVVGATHLGGAILREIIRRAAGFAPLRRLRATRFAPLFATLRAGLRVVLHKNHSDDDAAYVCEGVCVGAGIYIGRLQSSLDRRAVLQRRAAARFTVSLRNLVEQEKIFKLIGEWNMGGSCSS